MLVIQFYPLFSLVFTMRQKWTTYLFGVACLGEIGAWDWDFKRRLHIFPFSDGNEVETLSLILSKSYQFIYLRGRSMG